MSLLSIPVLVGVYENETQARVILEKLTDAGFNEQQLGMAMRKGLLLPHHIVDELLGVGIPEEDARLYESEFQAGYILILVRHDGRLEAAFKSLYNMTISLSATAQKQPESQASEETFSDAALDTSETSEAEQSLWRILKDAGLDHLL